MKNKKPTFIIFTWAYSEDSGGVIALHNLCHLLRKCDYDAYIWPASEPAPASDPRPFLSKLLNKRHPLDVGFNRSPQFDTPLAAPSDLKDAIVIYPEVVAGNPLNASKVVRWFLNKPGRLTGNVHYSDNEYCFFYQEAFNDETINPNKDNKLYITAVFDEVFKTKTPLHERSGTCYILRKGRDRAPVPAELYGPIIDHLPHEEVASIFNKHEYCVSYDLYTMYSAYAVMCGCKSIVIPQDGLPKEVWQPTTELSYGIAYGMDDLAWAEATKDKLIDYYKSTQINNASTVKEFAEKCIKHFSRS